MEVVFIEDPACSWCWAFQPATTAFRFEFGESVTPRVVMGGLRDHPVADVSFVVGQWKLAAEVSDMPFAEDIWERHVLQTTFLACQAVKAASLTKPSLEGRYLRRLREAFYVEGVAIDSIPGLLALAADVGLDTERLRDHLDSGRAEALFELDRKEACRYGFGFPTVLLRASYDEQPRLLQGLVPYEELVAALYSLGVPASKRRRFRDRSQHWERLFRIQPRLTTPELEVVTGMRRDALRSRLRDLGARRVGGFWSLAPNVKAEKVAVSGR